MKIGSVWGPLGLLLWWMLVLSRIAIGGIEGGNEEGDMKEKPYIHYLACCDYSSTPPQAASPDRWFPARWYCRRCERRYDDRCDGISDDKVSLPGIVGSLSGLHRADGPELQFPQPLTCLHDLHAIDLHRISSQPHSQLCAIQYTYLPAPYTASSSTPTDRA